MPLARRQLMQAVILAPPCSLLTAASREFWKNKKAAEWGTDEKEQLLSQSPWAREGSLRFSKEEKHGGQAGPPPGGGPPVAVPGARPGGAPGSGSAVTSVPFGEPPPAPPPGSGKGEPPQFRVMVRWESANPVRLAGGRNLPGETAQFYVILLIGMPLMRPRPAEKGEPATNPNLGMLEAIRQTSRLERKNKKPIPCAHLLTGEGERATELLLFFPKGPDPIVPADREVTVVSRFGPFQLSIRFPLKEMMFDGALEL